MYFELGKVKFKEVFFTIFDFFMLFMIKLWKFFSLKIQGVFSAFDGMVTPMLEAANLGSSISVGICFFC